jgi:uncharacterized protein YqjF (DUF2071 family)
MDCVSRAEYAPVEPVTPEPPRPIRRTLLNMRWLDVALLHWALDPGSVSGLMPRGVRPDVHHGATYVGLIALQMQGVGYFELPGMPYFGNFPQMNVRLYSVDEQGRRGVVFLSLDGARLIQVPYARLGARLPFMWAGMSVRRTGRVVDYAAKRRWPRPAGGDAHARFSIRIGERINEPSELEHFLTDRWGLHEDWHRKNLYLPNVHQPWRLHRAEPLDLDENLIAAAGLIRPAEPPVSVLYSPGGFPVRFGSPI